MTPGSYVSDICRAEQLRALRKGRTVIPVLAKPGADIPLHLETNNYRDFTKGYPAALKTLLEDIRLGRDAVVLAQRYRSTYVTAPPLPRNYVERPELLTRLREALLAEEPGASIAITALRGMGGIGKTILAQALAHDDVVQQAFPDGIGWTTIGQESAHSLTTRMREVRRALGDEPGDRETDPECVNRYRTALKDKAALIIVDDVWRVEDIEPFLADSPRSRLLFTTRDGSVAAAAGAAEHVADLLSEDQSRELLVRWAGLKGALLPAEAADVISECGNLPLALAMIGAMLRDKPAAYWRRVVDLLRSAQLGKFSAVAGYAHKTLMRAIDVSLEALDPQARERYLSLAVMLEDTPVHRQVQQTLWGVDAGEALETAETFVSRSLAQRDGTDGAIRLHDLQLDYARAQWPDKESLKLIHGAMRLSAHVIERAPEQFAGQMVGRLEREDMPDAVRAFAAKVANGAPRPWLRPLRPVLFPPGTPLLRTLTGHSGSVNAVVLTPDGRRAVSASEDGTLKTWDFESGRELRSLIGHADYVTGVAVTPDGTKAVSASRDGMLKVWDLESGRELRTLRDRGYPLHGVALAPDGRRAVSASTEGTLKVWDLILGEVLGTLTGHSGRVYGVAVTPDGSRAVSASDDETLKIWDLDSGCVLLTLAGHSDTVIAVAALPDGRRVVSASADGTLKVWDLESGGELRALTGHSDFVSGVAVTLDGRRAVSASWDKTLKVWDLDSGRELGTLTGHSSVCLRRSGDAGRATGRVRL